MFVHACTYTQTGSPHQGTFVTKNIQLSNNISSVDVTVPKVQGVKVYESELWVTGQSLRQVAYNVKYFPE